MVKNNGRKEEIATGGARRRAVVVEGKMICLSSLTNGRPDSKVMPLNKWHLSALARGQEHTDYIFVTFNKLVQVADIR